MENFLPVLFIFLIWATFLLWFRAMQRRAEEVSRKRGRALDPTAIAKRLRTHPRSRPDWTQIGAYEGERQ